MKKFAVFDIDGTLVRWQLYHAIADEMAKQGIIAPDDFVAVRKARMRWKERAHEDAFVAYEQKLIEVFDLAITHVSVSEFNKLVQRVFDEYHAQVYTYTRNLIQKLKEQDYILLAISGSPKQIVQLAVNMYGFDDFCASEYEEVGGKFSGNKQIAAHDKKSALQKLVTKHSLSFKGSIGVGDTISDIPMLELVERPVAFNPTTELVNHAKKRNWEIVVERKNVVYKLEANGGKYTLA